MPPLIGWAHTQNDPWIWLTNRWHLKVMLPCIILSTNYLLKRRFWNIQLTWALPIHSPYGSTALIWKLSFQLRNVLSLAKVSATMTYISVLYHMTSVCHMTLVRHTCRQLYTTNLTCCGLMLLYGKHRFGSTLAPVMACWKRLSYKIKILKIFMHLPGVNGSLIV